jgi:hypothetical protein
MEKMHTVFVAAKTSHGAYYSALNCSLRLCCWMMQTTTLRTSTMPGRGCPSPHGAASLRQDHPYCPTSIRLLGHFQHLRCEPLPASLVPKYIACSPATSHAATDGGTYSLRNVFMAMFTCLISLSALPWISLRNALQQAHSYIFGIVFQPQLCQHHHYSFLNKREPGQVSTDTEQVIIR